MRAHFSTDDLPPRDREETWLDFGSKHVISVTPGERSDPANFRAQLNALSAGRFTMFDLHTSHRINGRTGADVSRDNLDKFNLRRVSRFAGTREDGGDPAGPRRLLHLFGGLAKSVGDD